MIQLSNKFLLQKTQSISLDRVPFVFTKAQLIKVWLKTKPAYAVAANQIGIPYRFFVAHRRFKKFGLPTDLFFNPHWVNTSDNQIISEEKCLSYPGKEFKIKRYTEISLDYYDPYEKKECKVVLKDLPAIICQHEIMHLDGIDEEKLSNND